MTKISDLPVNLVEEILSKVPVEHMRAVRLTCKEWDTLSKSRSFSKMHIDKISAGESSMMVVALMGCNLYLIKVVNNEDPFIECKGKLTNCLDKKQIKISQVFHCNGLLLCVLKDDATKVIVWNPYWGQTRSIEFRYSVRPNGWDWFSDALGYEDKGGSSCRTYKLLRFIDQCFDYAVEDHFLWYEIYDFESSSWKTIDVVTPPHWLIRFHQHGVSLKGNTYWLASPRNTYPEESHIICFDFTSESFGPLLPLPFDAGDGDNNVTLSCVGEEKLAVLLAHDEAGPVIEYEMWITTKIEAEEVSWSKFLRVQDTEFYSLTSCDCFFIDEEKKVAMGFERDYSKTFNIFGEGGYIKKLELGERLGRQKKRMTDACSYVRSLVQIKQPAAAGGKRKRQSELEKQRYDQNMGRLVGLKNRSWVWQA